MLKLTSPPGRGTSVDVRLPAAVPWFRPWTPELGRDREQGHERPGPAGL